LRLAVAVGTTLSVALLLAPAAGAVPAHFAPAVSYLVGDHPSGLAIADLNGDGNLDVAASRTQALSTANISVLLGLGDGTLAPAVQYGSKEFNPAAIAIGDVNIDGKPDIAVPHPGNGPSGIVSVLLGVGDGTFAEAVRGFGRTGPEAIAIADVNHDGIPEIATANAGADNVSIFDWLEGDVVFLGDTEVGHNPRAIAMAPVSGPGSMHVITANTEGNDVTVSTHEGTNTFAVGAHPRALGVADLNGDSKLDLAVANESDGSVSTLLGAGDATFAPARSFAVPGSPRALAIGELNGDAIPDAAVANGNSGKVFVLEGDGSGGLGTSRPYSAGSGVAHAIGIGDLNHDGRRDIVTANVESGTVVVLISTPDVTSPDTAVAGPAAGSVVADNDPAFTYSGTPSDDVDHFECALDGQAFQTCPTAGRSYTNVSDGQHTFAVRAVDAAANADPSPARITWTIDTTAPETVIDSGPTGVFATPMVTNDQTPTFSFSSNEASATFACTLDAGSSRPCSSPYTASKLADGGHTFSVRATDAAGNADPTPATRSFTVAPKCSLISLNAQGIRICLFPVYAP
jgi:hypothetical protein